MTRNTRRGDMSGKHSERLPMPSPTVPARVLDWLLEVDPAVAWQAERDLLDADPADFEATRAQVETQGWGARLLAHQGRDGQWDGGAFVPARFDWSSMATAGQPWTATSFILTQLCDFGWDPRSPRAQWTVTAVAEHSRWEHESEPFWDGEVEECINGRLAADAAYYGVDASSIIERLLTGQQPDGGWNCERENGSTRSSFDSTINVLEGLLEFDRATGGTARTRQARHRGTEYLLERELFRRRSTGEVVDADYLVPVYPHRWHYDVLRALDHLRTAALFDDAEPDPRAGPAIEVVRSGRGSDGTWAVRRRLRGRTWFHLDDGVGSPSPWLTLRGWRVMRWWESAIGS